MVIGFVGGEVESEIGVKFAFKPDADLAEARADLYACREEGVASEQIERAREFPRVIVALLFAFFEVIELFQHGDGYDDVVLFELIDAGTVVQNDVGVEDEDFL